MCYDYEFEQIKRAYAEQARRAREQREAEGRNAGGAVPDKPGQPAPGLRDDVPLPA